MWWVTSGVGSSVPAASIPSTRSTWPITFAWPALERQRLDPDEAHVDLAGLGVDADRDHGAGLAGQPDREVERVGMADRVDRGVDAAPVGRRADRRRAGSPRSGGRGSRRSSRATSSRCATVSIANTGPAPAASATCTAHSPTGPSPSTATLSPGLDAALGDRVVAGAHHVAGEQRDVVGDALGHLAQRQVGHRHERLLGLRALQRAEQLAVAERRASWSHLW